MKVMKFILLSVFFNVVRSSPLARVETEAEIVNLELVRHHDDQRVRRDAGESDMPDIIVTKFTISGHNVILRLRRVSCPPVYFADTENNTPDFHHVPVDSAVYVDPSRSGAFMVSRSNTNHYFLLDGHLKHKGRQLSLKPQRRRRENQHSVIILQPEVINFGHDDLNQTTNGSSNDQGGEEVPTSIPTSGRKKRAPPTIHTVEICLVIDYKDYSRWLQRFPNDTILKLTEFYTYIGQAMNVMYTSVNEINSNIVIKVVVTCLYIIRNATDSFSEVLNTNAGGGRIDGMTFLRAFSAWIPSQSSKLPRSDHYMALTGYDIGLSGGEAVGVALKGEVCKGEKSVSVVENSFQASVASVAAHELGHCLSADHDGTNNACQLSDKYIMAPVFSVPPNATTVRPGNIFDFSICSVTSFVSYLAGQNCTLPAQTTTPGVLAPIGYDRQLVQDRDFQCRVATNLSNSIFCSSIQNSGKEAEICYGMLCQVSRDNMGRIMCTYVLPLEGTPCGQGRVCHQGVCGLQTTTATVTAPQATTRNTAASTSTVTTPPATRITTLLLGSPITNVTITRITTPGGPTTGITNVTMTRITTPGGPTTGATNVTMTRITTPGGPTTGATNVTMTRITTPGGPTTGATNVTMTRITTPGGPTTGATNVTMTRITTPGGPTTGATNVTMTRITTPGGPTTGATNVTMTRITTPGGPTTGATSVTTTRITTPGGPTTGVTTPQPTPRTSTFRVTSSVVATSPFTTVLTTPSLTSTTATSICTDYLRWQCLYYRYFYYYPSCRACLPTRSTTTTTTRAVTTTTTAANVCTANIVNLCYTFYQLQYYSYLPCRACYLYFSG